MIDAGAYAAIDKAHIELVIPALYQVADRRAKGPTESLVGSQWDQLRDVIAEMDEGAARALAGQKQKLEERLELIVVLKAVQVFFVTQNTRRSAPSRWSVNLWRRFWSPTNKRVPRDACIAPI